jgi:hypothetical protein
MSAITFSENHDATLIPFEGGEPLVSLRDPQGQALKWVYSLGAMPTRHVVVVGLGSGFHVAALADVDPSLKISVVENRESLLRVFWNQFPELADRVEILTLQKAQDIFKTDLFKEVLTDVPYVLSFVESWGQQGEFFTEVFAHLSGRSLESIKYHFQEFGINIKAAFLKNKELLSMKDVFPTIEGANMAENKKQIFRVLNELVK